MKMDELLPLKVYPFTFTCIWFIFLDSRLRLHGPPMLVDKTNFARPINVGLGICNHTNFYRFEKTYSYWSVKRISVFLCFSLVNLRHTSGITVYNRTVTNIENTVWAVHSCNSWFCLLFLLSLWSVSIMSSIFNIVLND